MKKISTNFIIDQYRSGLEGYTQFTKEVGLWESEKHVFTKYLKASDSILDIGCGTGRTTFPLYKVGYQKIRGMDLTPEMIEIAQDLNAYFETNIDFEVGDACSLDFKKESFEKVIFSFNGLMSIPGRSMREKAFGEIHRVLKKDGLFIFTTHDRDKESSFFEFWKLEEQKWAGGKQRADLYEFGDVVADSKNETRQIYIHIPNQSEVIEYLDKAGFELVETFYRSDLFDEPQEVKEKSGECRFWVVKKN